MIEIRLCSIAAANWMTGSSAEVPSELGLTFKRAFEKRLKELGSVEAVKQSPVEGLVIAREGVEFASSDYVASVAHALAYVSAYAPGSPDVADAIERFVSGEETTSSEGVPPVLERAGVTAALHGRDALRYAEWIRRVDRSEFQLAVVEMHGSSAVEDYTAVADSLQQIFSSVQIHGCDLCCLNIGES